MTCDGENHQKRKRLRRNQMKQYKGGYNVNRYDWKNKTTEHLLNDNNLADNHIPEWIRKNEIAAFWFWLIMSH
ncbi:TPA: hypothetical protein ACQ828_004376, partial [Escherichia coli]